MSFLMKRMQAPRGTVAAMIDKAEYSLREALTGRIAVTASEDFDVDEIRLEVLVHEWTKATQQIQAGGSSHPVTAEQNNLIHQGKITVTTGMHVTNGFNQQFPFSLNLPTGVPPTYRGRNANNRWRVKAVMAVKGRPDVVGHEMEIQINA